MSKLIVVVNYEIHRAAITQQYCVNKNKPLLACHGKCHLKKELAKQEKKQTIPVTDSKESFQLGFFSKSASVQYFVHTTTLTKFVPFNTGLINSLSFPIFRPPKLLNC